jgi:DNA-binding NarL/FixJ family response regulator
MKTILVVEDTPIFQAVIESALGDLAIETEPQVFSTGRAAISFCEMRSVPPDLALVDLGLPDMSGIQVIERLRAIHPEMPILVISVFSSERKVIDAVRAGAMGYVLKGDDSMALSQAITQVFDGHFPISPPVARYLFVLASTAPLRATEADDQDEMLAGRVPKLSKQERILLDHIAAGLSYRDASESMGLKLSTVLSYSRNLFRKLQVHSKTQALVRARHDGLIS